MTTRGIMADNMFLSQSQLLDWLNSTLMLKMEKIEEVRGLFRAVPRSALAKDACLTDIICSRGTFRALCWPFVSRFFPLPGFFLPFPTSY
jgi:hypothetical protein